MKNLVMMLVLSLLGSCSSIEAHADFEPGLDFSVYKTFAMAAPPSSAPASLPSYSEIGGRQINARISGHLESLGLSVAEESEADLIVSFALAGESREDVRSSGGASMGGGRYGGWYGSGWYEPNVYTVAYVRGTLVVDAFDRTREQVIWHGWSSVSLYSDSDAGEKGEQVIDAVMAKFPTR